MRTMSQVDEMSEGRNPYYDGLTVFRADLRQLLPGDVLVVRNRHAKDRLAKAQGDVIATGSRGHFSHALICASPPTFIEAIGIGVSSLSIQNAFAHSLEDVRMLRYDDAAIAKGAADWSLRRLGQRYSIKKAILSVTPGAGNQDLDDGIFCSALVAMAFRQSGSERFGKLDPLKITPVGLCGIDGFSDITNDVFKPLLAPPNIELMHALDGDPKPTPGQKQAGIMADHYDWMVPHLEAIFPHEAMPLTFLDAIAMLAFSLKTDHRQQLAPDVALRLEYLDAGLAARLQDGALDRMIDEMQAVDDRSAQRISDESFNAEPDLDIEDLSAVLVVTENQISQRNKSLADPYHPRGASQSWDHWLDITERVVKRLEVRRTLLTEVLGRIGG